MYCCLMVCRAVSNNPIFSQDHCGTYPALGAIKRVRSNAKLLLEVLAELRLVDVVLVVALERQVMDLVRKVVAVTVCAEIRDKLIKVVCAGTEGATRRKVDVANDLVHAYTTGDVAAFVRLLLQLL